MPVCEECEGTRACWSCAGKGARASGAACGECSGRGDCAGCGGAGEREAPMPLREATPVGWTAPADIDITGLGIKRP